ncbi:hypothetical protein ACFY4C_10115 [Actinomadura viridis]|uniref:hypothetical protein n=1 Tax=Actinomadura viridis TaxID=58110 RepID=UPI003677F283
MDGTQEPPPGRQGPWPDRLLVSRPEAARTPPRDPGRPAPVPAPRDPRPFGAPPAAPEAQEAEEGARGERGEFVPDVTGRPVWRLLLRGLGIYLPALRPPAAALPVSGAGPGAASARGPHGFGPPAFLNGDSGFGLHLPARRRGLEPDREIYVRGRDDPSFGIVIAGPAAAIGTRVVDAEGLLRYARRLTFEELLEPADADSVPYAVRAARAVHNVVFLDRAAGFGLCAEIDPRTRAALCPVFLRLGAPAAPGGGEGGGGAVLAYGIAAQAVRSHS